MAAFNDAPPTDREVSRVLGTRVLAPDELVAELELQTGHSQDACRSAVRRCLNRGLIQLSADFRLEASPVLEAAA